MACGARRFKNASLQLIGTVMLAKALIMVLGAVFAHVVTRRADGTGFEHTLGGVILILSTMSDDIGIGLPVLPAYCSPGTRSTLVVPLGRHTHGVSHRRA